VGSRVGDRPATTHPLRAHGGRNPAAVGWARSWRSVKLVAEKRVGARHRRSPRRSPRSRGSSSSPKPDRPACTGRGHASRRRPPAREHRRPRIRLPRPRTWRRAAPADSRRRVPRGSLTVLNTGAPAPADPGDCRTRCMGGRPVVRRRSTADSTAVFRRGLSGSRATAHRQPSTKRPRGV
jgi:hypothetical protein